MQGLPVPPRSAQAAAQGGGPEQPGAHARRRGQGHARSDGHMPLSAARAVRTQRCDRAWQRASQPRRQNGLSAIIMDNRRQPPLHQLWGYVLSWGYVPPLVAPCRWPTAWLVQACISMVARAPTVCNTLEHVRHAVQVA